MKITKRGNIFMLLFGAQDYFGKNFNFTFNKEEKFKTNFSIGISLLINCLSLALLINLSIELISKQNPNVNAVTIKENKGANMTLNSPDFFYSIRIVDKHFQFVNDPRILQVEGIYNVERANATHFVHEFFKLRTVNCSSYLYIFEEFNKTPEFYNNDLLNSICFGLTEQDTEVVIGGKFGSEFYGSLRFNFKKCKNSTDSKIICKSPEEIQERLDRGWIQSSFINRYINLNDYEDPIKHFVDGYFGNVDPRLNKIVYSYFNKVKVLTDMGLIFKEERELSSFKADYMVNDVNMLDNEEIIYTFHVISSFNHQIFFRIYMKLQGLAANIGGILKTLIFIGFIFANFMNKMKMNEIIINKLWKFVKPQITLKNFTELQTTPEENIKFTLSYYEIFMMSICCCKPKKIKDKEKIYDEIRNDMEKYLDFVDVLKYFQDVVKLKNIMLTQHQLVVFDNIKLTYDMLVNKPNRTNLKLVSHETVNFEQVNQSLNFLRNEDYNNIISRNILQNYDHVVYDNRSNGIYNIINRCNDKRIEK